MATLNIDNIEIKIDSEGRYCLNDLHKAAGEAQKDRPKYWLENDQTVAMITELEKGGIPLVLRQGRSHRRHLCCS